MHVRTYVISACNCNTCMHIPDMSSYIRSAMHVLIPAAARFCLNVTIVVLAQLHACRYVSLNPLRQLIQTIFCGWSTAFP